MYKSGSRKALEHATKLEQMMEQLFSSPLMKSAQQVPLVVICTDASFDDEMKKGSWACYIRCGDHIIRESALINKEVANSTEAERVGIAAALWIADKKFDLTKCRIILYCDNISAMDPVKLFNKTGKRRSHAKKEHAFFENNINKYLQKAIQVDKRHVKAHLDRTARHRMKKATSHAGLV